MRNEELTGNDAFEGVVAATSQREVSSNFCKGVSFHFFVTDNGQVQVPVRTIVRSPKSHILCVIEGEVEPDVLAAEESACTLLLFPDPIFEGRDDHFFKERVKRSRGRTNSIHNTISIPGLVAFEEAADILLGGPIFEFKHHVTAFIVPEAVMPVWILAAFTVPVAIIVSRVVVTTFWVVVLQVAFYPLIHGVDVLGAVLLTAIAVPVAVIPVWVLASISELIAVEILTCGVFIRTVRFSVLPAVDPVFKALVTVGCWFITALT